jgi:ATP-dependent Clp protease ATP-binding subunit ClpA
LPVTVRSARLPGACAAGGFAARQEHGMFERFTDRARRVVVVAQEESGKLGHNYIGTEHILLGILGAGGDAVSVLESLGISPAAVRQQVEETIGRGSHEASGHSPFTPRAKKVLEFSLREALQLGHNYIGTEHILLGLLREGEGVAARVLAQLGAELDRTREQVSEQLQGQPGAESGAYARPPRRGEPAGGLDAIRDRLDAITAQLASIVTKLGIGGEPGPEAAPGAGPEAAPGPGPDPEPMPEVLRQLDQRVDEIRAEKEAAIDAQEFERAVTLRNEERELRARRDVERELWLVATEHRSPVITASAAELDRLHRMVSRLQAQLRRHGIEPEAEAEAE